MLTAMMWRLLLRVWTNRLCVVRVEDGCAVGIELDAAGEWTRSGRGRERSTRRDVTLL
jgi:hypothetical protein